MNNIILLFTGLILLSPFTARAENNLFEQANQTYSRGEFEQAINLYQKIAVKEGISGSLLYNLANSYAATGQIGRAVVNYERALRLTPGHVDIQANLDQIRKDAGLYRDDIKIYERFSRLLEADQWLMLAGTAFLLLAIMTLTANLIQKFPPALVRLVITGSLLVIIITLPTSLFRYQSWNDGVIVGQEAKLQISPFPEAASTGTIKAGRLIRPEKTHADYVLIHDETGRSGWISRDSFELIAELP